MLGIPSKGRCLPEIITLQKVREVTKNLKNRAMPGTKGLPSHEDSSLPASGHQPNEELGLGVGGLLVA